MWISTILLKWQTRGFTTRKGITRQGKVPTIFVVGTFFILVRLVWFAD